VSCAVRCSPSGPPPPSCSSFSAPSCDAAS
jgi:hypothetical protein